MDAAAEEGRGEESAEYRACRLCPRRCGADRTAGGRGVCRETAELCVAWTGLHHGEEPPISGTRGAGGVFFAACPCHCIFCQNWQISAGGEGVKASRMGDEAFAAAARALLAAGAHNLDFVTPEHFWPHVRRLMERLRAEGATAPAVWNSSGYTLPERVADYARVVDIFLPDFKFSSPALAAEAMRAPDYPEVALAAIGRMVEEKGFLEPFDPTGEAPARTGTLVRHLVLPGHAAESVEALRLLRKKFGKWLPLSVMSQYTPTPAMAGRPPFDRPLRPEEYREVLDEVEALGFEQVFIQPLEGAERDDPYRSPDFSSDRPFPSRS